MKHNQHLAKHFKSIFFGGNWTDVNIKDTLDDISLKQANYKIKDCNTIAALVFHINCYIKGITPVFDGGTLDIKDKFSYDVPKFETEKEWEIFKAKVLKNAKALHQKISQLDEIKIFNPFVDEKYGSYYSNIHGVNEHTLTFRTNNNSFKAH